MPSVLARLIVFGGGGGDGTYWWSKLENIERTAVEGLNCIDVDDVGLMVCSSRLDWLTCTTSVGGAKRVVSTGVSSVYVWFSLLSDK